MHYSIVRITNFYPGFLSGFYEKNKGADALTYREQYERLLADSVEIAGCYTACMNRMGMTARLIITNAEALQRAWGRENGLHSKSGGALIVEQLKRWQPDVVWMDDFSVMDDGWRNMLRREVPSVRLLVGHVCAPFRTGTKRKFSQFDLMFTCTPCFREDFERLGVRARLLYHGFEPAVLRGLHALQASPASGIVFSGSLYAGTGFHRTRMEYIERLLAAGLPIRLHCNLEAPKKIAMKQAVYVAAGVARKLLGRRLSGSLPILRSIVEAGGTPVKQYSAGLLEKVRPPVFGYDMYRLLAGARICLNIHGDVAQHCAGNIRMFEATGSGTCLLTDWKKNIGELFEPDKEVVTFRNPEECIEKAKWLLDHPAERDRIAAEGQRRTLSQHTVGQRATQVNDILLEELNNTGG